MNNEDERDPAKEMRLHEAWRKQQERERAAALSGGINEIPDASTRSLAELLIKGLNSDSNSFYSNEIRAIEAAKAMSSLIDERIAIALGVSSTQETP